MNNLGKRHLGWLVVFFCCWAVAAFSQERRREGQFQSVTGSVTAQGPAEAQPRPAAKGDIAYAQDRVVSAAGAKAEIKLDDGSLITVEPSSRVQIVDSRTNARHSSALMVVVGWIQAVVAPEAGSNLEVQTATAVAGVRGTEFTVAAAADCASRVGVEQGKVQVSGRNQELTLEPKQQVSVELQQQKALAAEAYDPDRADWSGYLTGRAAQMAKRADKAAAEMDRELELRRQRAVQARQTLAQQYQQVDKTSSEAEAVKDKPDQYAEKREALKKALEQNYSQTQDLQHQDAYLVACDEMLRQLIQDVKDHPEKYSAATVKKVKALEATLKGLNVASVHEANVATLDSYTSKLDALVAKYELGRELQQREFFEKQQQQKDNWLEKRRQFEEQHRPH
jgi:hypothetical protein